MDYDALVRRLGQHVSAVNRKYPKAWQQVDELRAQRGKQLPDWPPWCFMPLSGAYAIVTGGRDDVEVTATDVGVVGALAAWRVTKGIYDFDPTVFENLWQTPVTGDIPAEVLVRLPEWCCYVPFPEVRSVLSDIPDCHGFFVHLEHDAGDGRRELRFLLDVDPLRLIAQPIHLVGTMEESVNAALDETIRQFERHGTKDDSTTIHAAVAYLRRHQAAALAPLVSLTLYLCSTTAEILGRDGQNKPLNRPLLRHTKRGTRMFPPDKATMWEVAYRLGKTLRAATPGIPGPDRGGSHASPRPHIRRAHWHAFWTGPKAAVGVARQTERKLELKWLPPTPVAVGDDHVIPTIHRIVGNKEAK
jgi:hypothetical protein